MWDLVGIGIGVTMGMGPLALAAWWDRRRAQAQAIQAEVSWKVGRELGRGLFAVRAVPAVFRGGRVYVDGTGLPEELSMRARAVAEVTVPEGYSVVHRNGRRYTWVPHSPSGVSWRELPS